MSTSSNGVVIRGLPQETAESISHFTDLRKGSWTRLGSGGNLGDEVTEGVLSGIAERAHQAARAQGYAQGWAEGRRVAIEKAQADADAVRRAAADELEQMRAEHRAAMAALETATTQMSTRLAEALDRFAGHTTEVALELAEAVVGREVATATDPGADALRRVIALADPQVTTTVRLNPADVAVLDSAVTEGHNITVVPDPTVGRGDAIAETDHTLVDATIAAALERVREVLTR